MKRLYLFSAVSILFAIAPGFVLADITDSYQGTVYYVSDARGSDSNDGLGWTTAKKTIDGALGQIGVDLVSSAQIWVSAETPNDVGTTDSYAAPTSTVGDGVSLFGGFDGTETYRWQRSWREHVTTIQGQTSIRSSALDGFTVMSPSGTGVVAASGYGLISHNIIKSVSVGIRCGECASPVIENNLIIGFSTTAIWAQYGMPYLVANNTIVHKGDNTGTTGVKLSESYSLGCDVGISLRANIIAGCAVGVDDPGDLVVSQVQANNDFYQDTVVGISGWQQITDPPGFVDPDNDDYRLSSNSPCIDVDGGNGYLEQLDLDGNPRFVDIPSVREDGVCAYDIGAYEYQAPPLVDRGLPTTNINSAAGANRANIRWADSDPSVFHGDTFVLPAGDWTIDRIRVWAIPSVPGYPYYNLGDHFSNIALYTGYASGNLGGACSTDLVPGSSNCINSRVQITPVVYADGNGYERPGGGFDRVWQIDFKELSLNVTGGQSYGFAVYGTPKIDRLWFSAASNAAASGWSGGAGDDSISALDVSSLITLGVTIDFTDPLAAWLGRDAAGSVRGSDINVQVFAHRQ